MNTLKLLNDKKSFDSYCSDNYMGYECESDDFPVPEKYPCYVYEVVKSWGYEESKPVYLYEEDLRELLSILVG